MAEKIDFTKDEPLPFWVKHRLSVLLIGTVVIVLILTVVSVFLYTTSGAAQLDLSRPGYREVSNKVESNSDMTHYPAMGPVTPKTIEEFLKLYREHADKAQAVDAFSGDPLNPEVLLFGSAEE